MFGALGDSAPDRWGRRLIARNEARRARARGQTPRAPREINFLLGVTDFVRQGALRFSLTIDGPFIAEAASNHVPPLINLGELLAAAVAFEDDPDSVEADDAVRLLLAPGSSLGGARPKASVLDRDKTLSIAKFPEKTDTVDAVRWEMLMLNLAGRAGISVPRTRVEMVGDTPVLLLGRFDRKGGVRIPFLSAMSLLDAKDGDTRSYVEIGDALRRIASHASLDAPQLWRRLAFNILASNFDDHLRNHAVVYDGVGWRLSPAYDLNPAPRSVKNRVLSTAINIDEDTTASIELAVDAAEEFLLTRAQAKVIAGEIAACVASWRKEAARVGIAGGEIDRMETAFEHEDAKLARHWA
jgi:serine/threonine-protein kinase HipA